MLHRIGCTGADAVVDPEDGGRLISLRINGWEVVGAARPVPGLPTRWFHGLFPMAPYAGMVRDSVLVFEGERVELSSNNGPHSGHGVVDDQPWTVTSATGTSLAMSVALDERWPWGGIATQHLELAPGRLRMTLAVRNDDRPMPATLGYHPWFRRRGPDGDASFHFYPLQRYVTDADGLPGELSTDLGARPWDDMFTDLHDDPTVTWPGGPSLRLTSDARAWTLFERCDEGFCIEPLTAPPNQLGTLSSASVAPGRPLSLTFTLAWKDAGQVDPENLL